MNTFELVEKNREARMGAWIVRVASSVLMVVLAAGLTGCASKEDDENRYSPAKRFSKPPRDPVEQRVFYNGWRHPSR